MEDSVTYRVGGMTCGGCVASVTRALERTGNVEVRVSLDRGTATVRGADEATVQRAIEAAGFTFGGRASEDAA